MGTLETKMRREYFNTSAIQKETLCFSVLAVRPSEDVKSFLNRNRGPRRRLSGKGRSMVGSVIDHMAQECPTSVNLGRENG
jgi:hypothetical protein